MIRHRRNQPEDITDQVLDDVQKSILDFHTSFKSTIAPVMKSEGQTIKYHRLSHVVPSIKRLGPLKEYNAQFYEASNKDEKTAYRTTNARLTDDEHLAGMVINQELRRALENRSTFDQDKIAKKRESAYLRAATTGENVMTKKFKFSFKVGTCINDMKPIAKKFMLELIDRDQITAAICAHFKIPIGSESTTHMPVVRPRVTAVLAAVVPWLKDATELQTVRATPLFFGKPYFDTVQVERKERGRVYNRYGLLRLIFQARLEESADWEDLVCVRMMQESRKQDILTKYGCKHFHWADGNNVQYLVCPLKSVTRRVYMPMDFDSKDCEAFHLSSFKWSRTPADL